jgi:hypothetical protein
VGGGGRAVVRNTILKPFKIVILKVSKAVTILLIREIFGLEIRLKKKSRDRFKEYLAYCPHEVHIHLLYDKDVSTK